MTGRGSTPRSAALRAAGVRPLFVLSAAPDWAAPDVQPLPESRRPARSARRYRGDYVASRCQLLQRYRGSQVQAWNEPNIAAFGASTPQRVAELTNALYRVAPRR